MKLNIEDDPQIQSNDYNNSETTLDQTINTQSRETDKINKVHTVKLNYTDGKFNFNVSESKLNGFKLNKEGNLLAFFYYYGKPLLVIGPDISYFIWTATPTFLSCFIYIFFCAKYLGPLLYVLVPFYFTYITFYLLVTFCSPGIPRYSNDQLCDFQEKGETLLFCGQCNLYSVKRNEKNYKVIHCKECGIHFEVNGQ